MGGAASRETVPVAAKAAQAASKQTAAAVRAELKGAVHAKDRVLVGGMNQLEDAVETKSVNPYKAQMDAYDRAQEERRLTLGAAMELGRRDLLPAAEKVLQLDEGDHGEGGGELVPVVDTSTWATDLAFSQGRPEDQLILPRREELDEMVFPSQIAAMLRLHNDAPELYTAAALAREFEVPEEVVEGILESCALPVVISFENDLYGVRGHIKGPPPFAAPSLE